MISSDHFVQRAVVVPRGARAYRTARNWQGRRRRGRRAAYPSFPAGHQHALIQARLINRLADSAERVEPPLTTLTVVKEVPNSLFDQFIGAPIAAASEFLLDLRSQIGR